MNEESYKFWSPLNDKMCLPNQQSKCKWHIGAEKSANPHRGLQKKSPQKLLPDVLTAVGNTPLIKLNKIPQIEGLKCEMYAKCEFFNPGGSVKDRIALSMIEDAEKQGLLKPGGTIIEPSSGNTGIGLALVATIKGYRMIVIMPERFSDEKEYILTALGAEVVRTPDNVPIDSPNGLFGFAHKLKQEIDNSIILEQFSNPGNPMAHYNTTAMEIYESCSGKVDMIVMGAGTGGTITGIGRKFKQISPHTLIIGADPIGSNVAVPESLNDITVPSYEVEGIGFKFKSTILDRSVVDKWIKISDKETMLMARRLIKEEGLLCGGSSGTAMVAAIKAAKDLDSGTRVVVILPDSIRNYLTRFIVDQWMEARDFLPCVNTNKHWWWYKDVSVLILQKPLSVLLNSTSKTALKIMKDYGVEQLPVEDSKGVLIGVLTLKNLMSSLTSKRIVLDDDISQCTIQIFPKVYRPNATLGLISRILEKEPYIIVLDTQKIDDVSSNTYVGTVTPMILLDYISAN